MLTLLKDPYILIAAGKKTLWTSVCVNVEKKKMKVIYADDTVVK